MALIPNMEALYSKLYAEYSKLKTTKESQLDEINREQEVKFMEFVSASETLVKHLTAEIQRVNGDMDELRNEVVSLRIAKDQQFIEFQDRLMEEKQKNRQLSAEMEQLRNLQQDRICTSDASDQPEEQHVNGSLRSPSVSRNLTDESPMRMTRKRARLFQDTDPLTSSPNAGHVQQSVRREISTDQSKSDSSKAEYCQGIVVDGGTCKCMFHGLVESLIGMKVSVTDQPEGKCICFVHHSSGYSFSLSWINEEELMTHVTSLGTFANIAPEWMREDIILSINMCPVFFERLSRVIKNQ